MAEKKSGAFLKDKYWGTRMFREATERAAGRTKKREGKSIPNEPGALVENYLRRFTDILEDEDKGKREHGIEALKRLLRQKYVVRPENISDEYIKGVLFGNFAEQKGYARSDLKDPSIKQGLLAQFRAETGKDFESYVIPAQERQHVRDMAVKDQETRLNSWFSYLTSPGAENYPAAYRYWAFAEMLKLGSYDDERKTYNERTEATAAPFPELDQQALALVLDEIGKKQKGQASGVVPADTETQEEWKKRLTGESFGKLYAFMQEHLKTLRLPTERLFVTEGQWRTFPKGSRGKEVAEALQGFHTQWCIAGEGTADGYLERSDLHIYFSKDAEGKISIPRACIVDSKEHGITEVRGIISDGVAKQHLDDYITPLVEQKLSAIPGGEQWRGQMNDMKRLASIHVKHSSREELSGEDLRFLYEIDGKIRSTGYDRDPRIKEILQERDPKDDAHIVFGCAPSEIAWSKKELERKIKAKERVKAYIGPLFKGIFNLSIEHLYASFPERRIGALTLPVESKEEWGEGWEDWTLPKGKDKKEEEQNQKKRKTALKRKIEEKRKDKAFEVSGGSQNMMDNEKFVVGAQEKLSLVHLSVEDLGFAQGATTQQIFDRAKELGLALVPPETGARLRLAYADQPAGEYLYMGMEQIPDADGHPHVFDVSRDEDGLRWLYDVWANPDDRWNPDDRFVFRKLELSA